MTVRLVLIDDDPHFTEALSGVLLADGRFRVIGTAREGRAGVEVVSQLRPDVVLMDIDMPIMDGVEASRRIHESLPDLPIVLVSGSQVVDRVANARAAGAAGYVQKSRIGQDLVGAILAVVPDGAAEEVPRGDASGCQPVGTGSPSSAEIGCNAPTTLRMWSSSSTPSPAAPS